MVFDDDPEATVVWLDERVLVKTGEGESHWFTDARDVWYQGVPVARSISFEMHTFDIKAFGQAFYGGGPIRGNFDHYGIQPIPRNARP